MHSCYLFRLSCQFPFLVLAIRVFLDFNGTSIGYRLFGAFADLNVLNTARMGSLNQVDSFRDHAAAEMPECKIDFRRDQLQSWASTEDRSNRH